MTEQKGGKQEQQQPEKLVKPIRRGDLYIRRVGISYEILQEVPLLNDEALSRLDELTRKCIRQTVKDFLYLRGFHPNRD